MYGNLCPRRLVPGFKSSLEVEGIFFSKMKSEAGVMVLYVKLLPVTAAFYIWEPVGVPVALLPI